VSRTPAAVLARLKVTYPRWLIYASSHNGDAARYFAHRRTGLPMPVYGRGRLELWADTPAGLELALIDEAETVRDRHGARSRSARAVSS
jgi:hypothetical protein